MATLEPAVAMLNSHFVKLLIEAGQQVAFSPYGLLHALLLLLKSVQGAAHEQLANALGLDEEALASQVVTAFLHEAADDEAIASAANIFVRDAPPAAAYTRQMEAVFGAGVERLISAAAVNKWCARHTRGAVPTLLDHLPPNAAVVLVSALYFKARWAQPFDAALTADAPFFPFDGAAAPRPMMALHKDLPYAATRHSQAVLLAYSGTRVAALVLLPKRKGRAGLLASVAEMSAEFLAETMWYSLRPVRLRLPRFRAEASAHLSGGLAALGATQIFEDADMIAAFGRRLAVSSVQQKCVVDVDEAGTTAAAATAVVAEDSISLMPRRTIKVNCNRPFVFALLLGSARAPLFTTVVQ